MKRVGRILLYSVLGLVLAVLLVLAGGYGFLQTKPGKAWFAATLSQALSTSGSGNRKLFHASGFPGLISRGRPWRRISISAFFRAASRVAMTASIAEETFL